MKRFSGICLITHDVPRLRQFYCDLLHVAAEGDHEYVTLATDEVDFSIVSARRMEQLVPDALQGVGRGNYTLEFEVEDVEREYQQLLLLAVPIAKPPAVHPWGRRAVWFHDPEGQSGEFLHASGRATRTQVRARQQKAGQQSLGAAVFRPLAQPA